jgi:hypothetical protein
LSSSCPAGSLKCRRPVPESRQDYIPITEMGCKMILDATVVIKSGYSTFAIRHSPFAAQNCGDSARRLNLQNG